MPRMRLDKYLKDMGIAGRSEIKQYIKSGRVTVDGVCVTAAETHIDPDSSCICFDGERVGYVPYRYFMLDKPEGVLTATEDRRQKTVFDLLTDEQKRLELFPVGRLDKDTSGLLLLTNDGEFAHTVISPKSEIKKLYYAEVEGIPNEIDAEAFRNGIVLADGTHCLPAELKPLGGSRCLVTVMEGKYHQVKRMLASRGKTVVKLRRLSIGQLQIDESLGTGGIKELGEEDLCKVFNGIPWQKRTK